LFESKKFSLTNPMGNLSIDESLSYLITGAQESDDYGTLTV